MDFINKFLDMLRSTYMGFLFDNIMWDLWVILGIILCLSEFIVPGFVICFFGAAAIVMGLVTAIFPSMALGWQIFIFTILSVSVIYASRKFFPEAFKGNKERAVANSDCDDFSHAIAITEETIKPGLVGGKVRFEGSYWTARSNEEIAAGEEVRVVARENITLIVEKIIK